MTMKEEIKGRRDEGGRKWGRKEERKKRRNKRDKENYLSPVMFCVVSISFYGGLSLLKDHY